MGARNITQLWDVINAGANLEVRCGAARCRHTSVIDALQLGRLAQVKVWNAALDALAMQMRCSKCGHRDAYLRSTCDPVTGPKVGPKSDAEAKALARMLRG
jgi:hypothetical protein